MLLFVAFYYGNLSTQLIKTDSVTARPCVWHINSVAQKREEDSEMSSGPHTAVTQQATGPVVCDWPRSPGEKRKKGCQICPTSRKLGRENRYLNLDHLYLKTSMLGYFDYIYTSQYFLTYFSGDYVRKSLIRHYR